MYKVYNKIHEMFYPEHYVNYIDALCRVYHESHFVFLNPKHEVNHYWFYERPILYIYNGESRVDIATYEGNDGSSYYKSQIKGCWVYDKVHEREIYWANREYERLRKLGYRYRGGPVPGVHKHYHMSCTLRYMHVSSVIRDSENPEVKEFVRPCRNAKNMPDPWDDYFIRPSRSWKDQCKIRHQYMKHWRRKAS